MDGALRLDQGQPPPVVIDNIGMIFGVTVALEAVNLAVSGGELVAVIGPSGCGKSTLLRIVAGLVEPTDGVVTVGGLSPHEILAQHDCGFLFQTPLMLPWLTLRENVALAGRLIGVRKRSASRGRTSGSAELGSGDSRIIVPTSSRVE